MSDLDTFRDMQAMREQLSAAKSARRRRRHQLQQERTDTPVGASSTSDEAETSGSDDDEAGFDLNAELEEFRSHAETFLKDLEEGLDDVPTSTALGIFALGVLVGRLSR